MKYSIQALEEAFVSANVSQQNRRRIEKSSLCIWVASSSPKTLQHYYMSLPLPWWASHNEGLRSDTPICADSVSDPRARSRACTASVRRCEPPLMAVRVVLLPVTFQRTAGHAAASRLRISWGSGAGKAPSSASQVCPPQVRAATAQAFLICKLCAGRDPAGRCGIHVLGGLPGAAASELLAPDRSWHFMSLPHLRREFWGRQHGRCFERLFRLGLLALYATT